MDLILLLLLCAVMVSAAIYVLVQDPRGRPQQLFAALALCYALMAASGVVRFGSEDFALANAAGATVAPLVGLSSILLLWLILLIFIPHRAAQPAVFWALTLPYILPSLFVCADALFGLKLIYLGLVLNKSGFFEIDMSSTALPLLILYILGQVVLIIMTASVGIADSRRRNTAWTLSAALIFSLFLSGMAEQTNAVLLTYFSSLPLYMGFAWATLRFGLFRPSTSVLRAAVAGLPDCVIIVDDQQTVRYANPAAQALLRLQSETSVEPIDRLLAAAGLQQSGTTFVRHNSAPLYLDTTRVPIVGDQSAAQVLVLRDVTERERQAEILRTRNEEQQRLLDLVETLELPITTLADGVAFVPVIGHLDTRRGQQLTARLLEAVHTQRLRAVILDVAGVADVDTAVAKIIQQAAQGLQLLGSRVVVTGIAPSLAVSLSQLNVPLREVTTVRSPQEALALLSTTAPAPAYS